MAYTPTSWTNGSGQPVSAANLNKIEQGVKAAHDLADAAAPSSHTHTPASIGAAPASHTHDATDLTGVVKSVNGTAPDSEGDVAGFVTEAMLEDALSGIDTSGTVTSVNGVEPDVNGNVTIDAGGLDVEAAIIALGVVNGNGATQAQIDAWRAIRPDVIILGTGSAGGTPVTAAAPTFTDELGTANDTYTIPTSGGVEYRVGGATKAAGTYPASGTVTITAVALPGFALNGTASWTHTFSTTSAPTEVTATAPTHDDTANTYTIPATTGVDYKVGGVTTAAGTYSVGDVTTTVTVTAAAQLGYALTGTTSWTLEFTATPTAAPISDTFDRATASTLGPNWTDPSNGFGITDTGTRATTTYMPTAPASHKALYTGGDGGVFTDVKVGAELEVPASSYTGVLARASTAGDTFYFGRCATASGSKLQIYSFVDGTATSLAETSYTWTTGDRIELEVKEVSGATQLRLLVNGAEKVTATDTNASRPTSGVTGIRASAHPSYFDNFTAAAI